MEERKLKTIVILNSAKAKKAETALIIIWGEISSTIVARGTIAHEEKFILKQQTRTFDLIMFLSPLLLRAQKTNSNKWHCCIVSTTGEYDFEMPKNSFFSLAQRADDVLAR